MHYFAVAIVPDRETAKEAVEGLMAPYSEHDSDDGKWDWWVLGGRWTGVWSDYDPTEDPANWDRCFLCEGTGIRDDKLGRQHREKHPEYTCNGCGHDDDKPSARPAGMRVKHAGEWADYEGDVLPVGEALEQDRVPHALITVDGWLESETWNESSLVKTPDWDRLYRETLAKYEGQFAAIVDYHC